MFLVFVLCLYRFFPGVFKLFLNTCFLLFEIVLSNLLCSSFFSGLFVSLRFLVLGMILFEMV